jgi:hypothetical protein
VQYANTEPVRQFAQRRGLSPTTVYAWIKDGLIETFLIGTRRHVVLESYERLVQQLIAEQNGTKLNSSNPKAKRRATEATVPKPVPALTIAVQRRRKSSTERGTGWQG